MSDATEHADAREAPIDAEVVSRTAGATDVSEDDLGDALVVLGAELIGRHAEFESAYEYATVDGRRAYLADEAAWTRVATDVDLDERLATAARRAHGEQARLLFDEAVRSGRLDGDAVGIVVGVDTAEEMT
jgi:hypothetical protein